MSGQDAARFLRRGLLGLAVLGVLGAAAELASLRHWGSPVRVVPWVSLAVAAAAIALVGLAPSPARVRAGAWLAGAVLASGAYGVIEHVVSNLEAASLDQHYGPRWAAMSNAAKLWAAGSMSVGPSPPLAPRRARPGGPVRAAGGPAPGPRRAGQRRGLNRSGAEMTFLRRPARRTGGR
ncbi:MAG: hypothetical protein ACKVWR_21545 [Acidimicrobiales bacterium]